MGLLEDVRDITGKDVVIERWDNRRAGRWHASVCGKVFSTDSRTDPKKDLNDQMTAFLRGIVAREKVKPKLRAARRKRHSLALPLCRGV